MGRELRFALPRRAEEEADAGRRRAVDLIRSAEQAFALKRFVYHHGGDKRELAGRLAQQWGVPPGTAARALEGEIGYRVEEDGSLIFTID